MVTLFTVNPNSVMSKIIPIFFFILLFHGGVHSQMFYLRDSIEIVRLEKELVSTTGINKIDLENQIAAIIVNYNPEKSFRLSQTTLSASEELSYPDGKAFALSNLGFYYFLQSEFIEAFQYQAQALDIVDNSANKELKMLIHERMGYIYYFSKADERQIINHYGVVMKYNDEIGYRNKAATILVIMGGGAYRIGKYQEALDYFNYFLTYTKDLEIPRIEKLIVSYSLGDIYYKWGEMDKAFEFYKNSVQLMDYTFVEEMALNANIYLKIGDYYLAIGQPDSALIFINKCYKLSKSIIYTRGQMKASNRLGSFYKSIGDFEKSISFYEAAYRFGYLIDSTGLFFHNTHFNKYIDVSDETWMSSPKAYKKFHGKLGMLEGLTNLLELYQLTNQQENAIGSLNILLNIKDDILKFQTRKELMELKLKYESENKEQQIELLARENEIQKNKVQKSRLMLISFAGFLFLIILMSVLYIRQNKLRVEQEKTNLQQKLLRSQMNPHFIFNSLASIQNSIINEEPVKASKYLARFSKLVRNILDSSVEEFITLEEEIITIENYLALQKIRFPEKFDYSIEVDERLDPESIYVPPMLAQPFIENAIEHGIKHKDSKGNIRVRLKLKDNKLLFEVEDDGVGREKAHEILLEQDKNHKSMATSITGERIRVLNKKLKTKISLSIEDLKDEKGEAAGTMVRFELPVK